MINQRAYPNILLGFGSGNQTIAGFGCYAVSLLQGLLDRGYSYSVASWNDLLKARNAFVNKTSLSSTLLAQVCSDIFLEGRNEAWNDANIIKYLVTEKDNYVVLGEVDARGIGGSGQHFVYIQKLDVSNGKVTMSYIGDPWDGQEMAKVTVRYNSYGNIKSLRVFKIKKGSTGNGGNMSNMYKGYDLSNAESMKVAVDILVRVQSGEYVERATHEKALNEQKTQLNKEKDEAIKSVRKEEQDKAESEIELAKKANYDEGYNDGYAKGKSENTGTQVPNVEVPAGFEMNGMQTSEVVNGVTVTKNYGRKA